MPDTKPPLVDSTSSLLTPPTSSIYSRTQNENLMRKALQQSMESVQLDRRLEFGKSSESDTTCIYSQRAFKKSSQNGKLTLYLASRDLIVSNGKIDKIQGVLLIDPEILQGKKVILTFRYGREDEEVMGLKFCNEAIMSLAQLYPPYYPTDRQEPTTLFQEVLVKRFYPNAHSFTMAVTPLAPPSVQLVPAKEYNGAPIGTSYDIRVYVADRPDEKLTRKMQIIRMGIRVIQGANTTSLPKNIFHDISNVTESTPSTRMTPPLNTRKTLSEKNTNSEDKNEIKAEKDPPVPHAMVEKQFLLTDGRVRLEASLDRSTYSHGDSITVRINVTNNSNKSVKRIEADIVQHVDVCMFSNGKFKNIVAQMCTREGCPVEPGFSLSRSFVLKPEKGTTKNWIALEDDPGYAHAGANLASTVVSSSNLPEDRNVFAIYVSYYVKVKIVVSPIGEWIGGVVSLKLPFTLAHTDNDLKCCDSPSLPLTPSHILNKIETVDDPNEDVLPFIDKDNTSDEEQDEGANKDEQNITIDESIGVAVTGATPETSMTQTRRDSMSNADLIEHYKEEDEHRTST